MTAPVEAAPATGTAGEQGGEGQAPDTTGGQNAGPGDYSRDADAGKGKRAPGERVRSASREDDAPREDDGPDLDVETGRKAAGAKGEDWRMEDLPPGVQKHIKELRAENATRRTESTESKKAREAAEKRATDGDDRFAKAVEAFTKAIGLTPEVDEPQRSPEELLGEAQSNYKNARVELAVFRNAGEHDADPDALLDSTSFMKAVRELDPTADDFADQVADAIADAVERNPKLRAENERQSLFDQAPSGGDFGGGPAERSGPDEWSVDDFRRARKDGRGPR